MDKDKNPGIKVGQVFLKRAEFDHAPGMLETSELRQANEHMIRINVSIALGADDATKGLVLLSAETRPNNPGCYQFKVEMAGLFETETGAENMTMADYLQGPAIAAMFPFLREAVANITGRGRFGSVWLKALNIAAIKLDEVPATEADSAQ